MCRLLLAKVEVKTFCKTDPYFKIHWKRKSWNSTEMLKTLENSKIVIKIFKLNYKEPH